jgi:WD40 repeat protein
LYDESGQKLLHSYKYSKPSGAPPSLKDNHLRGIGHDGKEWLYIGNGSGEIISLHVTKTKITLGKIVPPPSTVSTEGQPEGSGQLTGAGISSLSYSSQHSVLASGDDWGNIFFWSVNSDNPIGTIKPIRAFEGKGIPVNCLGSGHGFLAAGYASGHLRLFDLSKKCISVEIVAHTRAINAIDVHANKPIVLAAAEDTFVSVWSLPSSSSPQVKNLSSESPVLGLITGCRFGGTNQELIITATYDSRALAIMHTP